jgi:hypothetical protein
VTYRVLAGTAVYMVDSFAGSERAIPVGEGVRLRVYPKAFVRKGGAVVVTLRIVGERGADSDDF